MKAFLLHRTDNLGKTTESAVLNHYRSAMVKSSMMVTTPMECLTVEELSTNDQPTILRRILQKLVQQEILVVADSDQDDLFITTIKSAARACGMEIVPATRFASPITWPTTEE